MLARQAARGRETAPARSAAVHRARAARRGYPVADLVLPPGTLD